MKQTDEELREHFQIERELANRLRDASKSERRELYGAVYSERSARIPHHPLVRAASDPGARAQAVAPQVRLCRRFVSARSTFLEVGAGDGAVARALCPSVMRAIAADVTDALAPPPPWPANFDFVAFDGFELPLEESSIDFVYSNDVVEHLHQDDLSDHLQAIRRVLRRDGSYLCVTPNRLSGPHDVSRHFSTSPAGFHLREYTTGELADAFLGAGFSEVGVVASVSGYSVDGFPGLPLVRAVERTLELLPHGARRRAARPLAGIKLIGRA